MIRSISKIRSVVLVAGLFLVTAGATPPGLAASLAQNAVSEGPAEAGEFLTGLGNRAVQQLTDTSLAEEERARRFRALLEESFDMEAVSRFVLGRYWRTATEQQRRDFVDVFEDTIVQRFAPMFGLYSFDAFTIERVRRDRNKDTHVFVTTLVKQSDGEHYAVDWRLAEQDSTYRILDIFAEGISMAITLRQEYASVIRQRGLEGLIEALRKKVAAGSFVPKLEPPE